MRRAEIQAAVEADGWRLVLGWLATSVPATDLAHAASIAAAAADAAAADGAHLKLDVRADRVLLRVQSPATGDVREPDVELAHRLSAVLDTTPDVAGTPVLGLEVAIDALDIPAVLPFWRAVLGYVDEPDPQGQVRAVVDPAGVGPAFWFQQMDSPRPQRNRIHLDVVVAHDQADARVAAALAAGGRMVNDAEARSFWVLADAEGNEACVCTWQDRD